VPWTAALFLVGAFDLALPLQRLCVGMADFQAFLLSPKLPGR
jgi:hypothetical protein